MLPFGMLLECIVGFIGYSENVVGTCASCRLEDGRVEGE